MPMLLETEPQDFHLFVKEREDLNAKQKLDLYEAFVKNRNFVLSQTNQIIQEHLRSAFLPLAKQQELIELFQDLTSESGSDREFKAQMEKIPPQGADLLDNDDVIEAQKALLKKEVRKFRLKQAQLKDKQRETQLQLKNEVSKFTELATEMDVKLIKAVRDHSLDSDKKVLILDYRHAEERDARAGVMPVHRQEFYRSVRRVLRYFDELAECDLLLEQVEEDMRNCSAQNEFYFNTTDVFNPYAVLRVFLEEDAQIELKCFDSSKLLDSEEFQLIQEFQTPLGRINLYEVQICYNRQAGNFEFQKLLQYP